MWSTSKTIHTEKPQKTQLYKRLDWLENGMMVKGKSWYISRQWDTEDFKEEHKSDFEEIAKAAIARKMNER